MLLPFIDFINTLSSEKGTKVKKVSDKIIYEKGVNGNHEDSAATIFLNNPEKDNLVDSRMLSDLIEAVKSAGNEKGLKLLVIDSKGNNFCAGRDPSGDNSTVEGFRTSISSIVSLNSAIASLKCVSMSVVRGKAMGMGAGIAMQTDLTLASDDAVFGFTEINYGLPPTIVLSYINRWIPKKRANEMIFTGKAITAGEAERFSLVNEITGTDNLSSTVEKWVDIICSKNTDAIGVCKEYLKNSEGMTTDKLSEFAIDVLTEWKTEKLKN